MLLSRETAIVTFCVSLIVRVLFTRDVTVTIDIIKWVNNERTAVYTI